jgi:putative membrane protein
MSGWGFHTGWFWQPIMMVVLFVVIVLGIIFLVRWKAPQAGPPEESALDILKKRYARGEISKEEFEEKRRHIES